MQRIKHIFYKRVANININILKPTKTNLIYTFDFKHKFEYKFSLLPQAITIRKFNKKKKINQCSKRITINPVRCKMPKSSKINLKLMSYLLLVSKA